MSTRLQILMVLLMANATCLWADPPAPPPEVQRAFEIARQINFADYAERVGARADKFMCNNRAAAWMLAMENHGIYAQQATTFTTGLNAMVVSRATATQGAGVWNFHTAPVIDQWVIDPGWNPEGPMPLTNWVRKFGGGPAIIHEPTYNPYFGQDDDFILDFRWMEEQMGRGHVPEAVRRSWLGNHMEYIDWLSKNVNPQEPVTYGFPEENGSTTPAPSLSPKMPSMAARAWAWLNQPLSGRASGHVGAAAVGMAVGIAGHEIAGTPGAAVGSIAGGGLGGMMTGSGFAGGAAMGGVGFAGGWGAEYAAKQAGVTNPYALTGINMAGSTAAMTVVSAIWSGSVATGLETGGVSIAAGLAGMAGITTGGLVHQTPLLHWGIDSPTHGASVVLESAGALPEGTSDQLWRMINW